MLDKKQVEDIRRDFPFLEVKENKCYFDNAATSQKPKQVIEAVREYYEHENGNPNRGTHYFAEKATQVHEDSRKRIADFIGARPEELVFTRSTTEALNLLAYVWGLNNLKEGDEILLSIMEHHANLVNWQFVSKKTGAKLVYLYLDDKMEVTKEEFEKKLSSKTKLFTITGASNTLGVMPDVKAMIKRVREVSPSSLTVVDGAQLTPHSKVDVKDLDCDFFAFSGHKMLGYMGLGVLYGKYDKLNALPPFNYGGEMIEYVTEESSTFLDAPRRFEAGTVDVGGAKSLASAIDYMEKIGLDDIEEYEKALTDYAYEKMDGLDYLDIYTPRLETRAPLISFNFKEIHPHDVSTILYSKGVAIRSGHHCTHPLHRYLDLTASCRASFAFYNTFEEIDYFIDQLEEVRRMMGLGS